MKDPLIQLLREADESASVPPARSAGAIADAVRRRRRHEQLRGRAVAGGCVIVAVIALGFSLRPREPEVVVAKRPASTSEAKVSLAQLDLDARLAEMTARRLVAAETRRRAPLAGPIDIQQQRDRAALVLVYEGDGYARGKRATDAIASYQRAIELFPQSRWADVARQRLKELNT
jgi:hypothetical protein